MNTIAIYETILTLSSDMLVAARQSDWIQLCALEKRVAALREQLKEDDPPSANTWAGLSSEWREHKVELIRRILDLDRQIREYAEPQLETLRKLLSGHRQGRSMTRAYSAMSR